VNKGEVKPLTSGERASISKFHIVVTPRQRKASDLSTSLPQPTGNTSQLLPCSALAVVSIKEDPIHI
jgi:hypothetical protein